MDKNALKGLRQEYQSVHAGTDPVLTIITHPFVFDKLNVGRYRISILGHRLCFSPCDREHGWSDFVVIEPLEPLVGIFTHDVSLINNEMSWCNANNRLHRVFGFMYTYGCCFGEAGIMIDKKILSGNFQEALDGICSVLNDVPRYYNAYYIGGHGLHKTCTTCDYIDSTYNHTSHKGTSALRQCEKCHGWFCKSCDIKKHQYCVSK